MAGSTALSGAFVYLLVLVLFPYALYLVFADSQGALIGATAAVGLMAIGIVGVRRRGLAFFAIFGDAIDRVTSEGGSKQTKVPRPPSYWTSKLVEAVGGQCEVQSCRRVTHLQVHHIDPHSRGGGNQLSNLMVACPQHHKDCDRGSINKTRQKTIVGRQNRFTDASFPARWSKSVLKKDQSSDDPFGF